MILDIRLGETVTLWEPIKAFAQPSPSRQIRACPQVKAMPSRGVFYSIKFIQKVVSTFGFDAIDFSKHEAGSGSVSLQSLKVAAWPFRKDALPDRLVRA